MIRGMKSKQILESFLNMKASLLGITAFCLIILSCKPPNKELAYYSNDFVKNQDLSSMEHQDSIVYLRMRGRLEEEKMISNLSKKNGNPFSFSSPEIKYVKAFPITCQGECYNSVFSHRTSQGTIIHLNDFQKLITVLENPNAFNLPVAACFEPQVGLILYNSKRSPIGKIEICLGCNSIRTYPKSLKSINDNTPFTGFSKNTRRTIRELLIPYGFSQLNFTNTFDK